MRRRRRGSLHSAKLVIITVPEPRVAKGRTHHVVQLLRPRPAAHGPLVRGAHPFLRVPALPEGPVAGRQGQPVLQVGVRVEFGHAKGQRPAQVPRVPRRRGRACRLCADPVLPRGAGLARHDVNGAAGQDHVHVDPAGRTVLDGDGDVGVVRRRLLVVVRFVLDKMDDALCSEAECEVRLMHVRVLLHREPRNDDNNNTKHRFLVPDAGHSLTPATFPVKVILKFSPNLFLGM